MTLTVPDTEMSAPLALQMEGTVGGRARGRSRLVRSAVPCEKMMQAFIWHHLVPVEQWSVLVSGKRAANAPFQLVLNSDRLVLLRGADLFVNVAPLVKNIPTDQLRIELDDPPEGVSASIETREDGRFAVKLTTSADIEPELRGNLLFNVYKEYTPEPTESNPAPKPRRTDYGFLPAIPFEISKRKAARSLASRTEEE